MKETESREKKAAAQTKIEFSRILVPTDFTPGSDFAFACALDLARRYDADIDLMHVMDTVEGDAFSLLRYSPEAVAHKKSPNEIIYDLLNDTLAQHDTEGVFVNLVRQRGSAVVQTLVRHARNSAIDLIVVGIEDHEGLGRYFSGRIAEEIVRTAPCPVLTVKHRGRDTA